MHTRITHTACTTSTKWSDFNIYSLLVDKLEYNDSDKVFEHDKVDIHNNVYECHKYSSSTTNTSGTIEKHANLSCHSCNNKNILKVNKEKVIKNTRTFPLQNVNHAHSAHGRRARHRRGKKGRNNKKVDGKVTINMAFNNINRIKSRI